MLVVRSPSLQRAKVRKIMSISLVFLIFKWFVPVFLGFTGGGGLRLKESSVKYKVLQWGRLSADTGGEASRLGLTREARCRSGAKEFIDFCGGTRH